MNKELKRKVNERLLNASDMHNEAYRSNNKRSMKLSDARGGMLNYFIEKYIGSEWYTTQD